MFLIFGFYTEWRKDVATPIRIVINSNGAKGYVAHHCIINFGNQGECFRTRLFAQKINCKHRDNLPLVFREGA